MRNTKFVMLMDEVASSHYLRGHTCLDLHVSPRLKVMCVVLPVPVGQTHLRVLGEPLGVGDPVTWNQM